jgi:hypothetical protein
MIKPSSRPSAVITAPLTLLASSLLSHETRVAISSGCAIRKPWRRNAAGVGTPTELGMAVHPMLVSTPPGPGQTALHRMPSSAYRYAIERVKPITPCFEAVYAVPAADPANPPSGPRPSWPAARRRPWKLAREVTTLDRLSYGRAILGVGLGNPIDAEYGAFGEPTNPRILAGRLDEGLEIVDGLLVSDQHRRSE